MKKEYNVFIADSYKVGHHTMYDRDLLADQITIRGRESIKEISEFMRDQEKKEILDILEQEV